MSGYHSVTLFDCPTIAKQDFYKKHHTLKKLMNEAWKKKRIYIICYSGHPFLKLYNLGLELKWKPGLYLFNKKHKNTYYWT